MRSNSNTSTNHHPRTPGALPEVEIQNWGAYVTLEISVESHSNTSFIYPAEGQSVDELIYAIRAALANVVVTTVDRDAYAH